MKEILIIFLFIFNNDPYPSYYYNTISLICTIILFVLNRSKDIANSGIRAQSFSKGQIWYLSMWYYLEIPSRTFVKIIIINRKTSKVRHILKISIDKR